MLSQRVPLTQTLGARSLDDASCVVVSGYVLLEPAADLAAARAARRRFMLGCSLGPPEVDGWLAAARSLEPQLLVLNADEAGMLCGGGGRVADVAHGLSDSLGCDVVVTHASGATACADRNIVDVPAPVAGPTVDATGAGDAFAAGMIHSLLRAPWPPSADVLRSAMADGLSLAAAVAGVAGAQGRVPAEGSQ
jgi:sugar/nucleoside kinase (ribokinase family)